MDGNFRLTFTATNEYPEETIEMSKIELQAHFPKQTEMLENSPCSTVALPSKKGDCTVIIEKL